MSDVQARLHRANPLNGEFVDDATATVRPPGRESHRDGMMSSNHDAHNVEDLRLKTKRSQAQSLLKMPASFESDSMRMRS